MKAIKRWVGAAVLATVVASTVPGVQAQERERLVLEQRATQRIEGSVFLFLLHPFALSLGVTGLYLADQSSEAATYVIAGGLITLGIGALVGAIVELVGGVRLRRMERRR